MRITKNIWSKILRRVGYKKRPTLEDKTTYQKEGFAKQVKAITQQSKKGQQGLTRLEEDIDALNKTLPKLIEALQEDVSDSIKELSTQVESIQKKDEQRDRLGVYLGITIAVVLLGAEWFLELLIERSNFEYPLERALILVFILLFLPLVLPSAIKAYLVTGQWIFEKIKNIFSNK